MLQHFLLKTTIVKDIIRRHAAVAILLITELIIIAANYTPGTWLMGWDNVMPEFNFRQALITNLFGAWQEHRGLGLADGMGHAANLVHTIIAWVLSLPLPQHAVRYAFHFLMHLAGMAGMYVFLGFVIPGLNRDPSSSLQPDSGVPHQRAGQAPAGMTRIIGALFYGLNLITVQMFFTPLEAFSVHFASLPWLAWSLTAYLKEGRKQQPAVFAATVLILTPQFFIPTLVLPITILLVILALPFIKSWKRVLTAAAIYLAVNTFWLLPYGINLTHNAPVIQSAKINQMSSGEVYVRNQVFGDIGNVLLMRGFMLDFEDVDTSGTPVRIMQAWNDWIHTPLVRSIHVLFIGFLMLGIYAAVSQRKQQSLAAISLPTLGIWSVSFLFLANSTPVLSGFMELFRHISPVLAEAYRFAFTKFSLLYAFA